MRKTVIAVALMGAAVFGCSGGEKYIGKPAPEFTAIAVNTGAEVDIKKLGAKPIILYFFASW